MCVIRSLLQVGFCFQYQLINFFWLSFDFFSFSWSLTICFFVPLYSWYSLYPFFSSTFWALIICDIHFYIWKMSKFTFMGSPFGPFCSVIYLNVVEESCEIRILSRLISIEFRTKFVWFHGLSQVTFKLVARSIVMISLKDGFTARSQS